MQKSGIIRTPGKESRRLTLAAVFAGWVLSQGFSAAAGLGQDIFQAVQQRDQAAVKTLLEKTPDQVSARNPDGMTPLHMAAAYGLLDIARCLIENGADANARDKLGNPPLHYCAYGGSRAVAQLLVSRGAEVKVRNAAGISPLRQAVSFGRKDVAEFLLEKGAEIDVRGGEGRDVLRKAVENGMTEIIDLLLREGVRIDARDKEAAGLLHGAARCGHVALLDRLMKGGADILAPDKKGGTLWHSAAEGGCLELMEILARKGLDVNARNDFSLTPLHKAAWKGNKAAVERLLAVGADVQARSSDGTTPLMLARAGNHQGVIAVLKAAGADDSPKRFPRLTGDYFGLTPPGSTPKLFAPGIVSTEFEYGRNFAGTFSPDGNEFFFTRGKTGPGQRIWRMIRADGAWSEPRPAPFTAGVMEFEPFISPDGKKLFFGSLRPKPGSSQPNGRADIWVAEKTDAGWSEPRYLDPLINDLAPMYISASSDGTLYFTGNLDDRGLYSSVLRDGRYRSPVRLPGEINSLFAAHPYIAPDESYLIFDGKPLDNPEKDGDLYISFKNKDGSWTPATRLDDPINSGANEMAASVSPDGKYLFFESNRSGTMCIYWVDARALEALRPKPAGAVGVGRIGIGQRLAAQAVKRNGFAVAGRDRGLFVLVHVRVQVFQAGVGHQRDDLGLRPKQLGDLNRGDYVCSGRRPCEEGLFSRDAPGHGFRVVGLDRQDLVHERRIPEGRRVADPGALDLVRPGGSPQKHR